jgi:hypothetical protein
MVFGIEAELLIRWLGFALLALLAYQGISGYYMRRSRVSQARRAHRWIGVAILAIAGSHAAIALLGH